MDTIIDIQNENFKDLLELISTFTKYLPEIKNMSINSQSTVIDKLRLLNTRVKLLEDEMLDIINDLKNSKCNLDPILKKRLEQEDQINNNIKELTPIILLYLMNKSQV